jgi:hypothetical protein
LVPFALIGCILESSGLDPRDVNDRQAANRVAQSFPGLDLQSGHAMLIGLTGRTSGILKFCMLDQAE